MTFGGMGSQKLDAPNIEYVVNNDTHPGAQFNEQFRSIVKSELARVSALDNVQTAQTKALKPSQVAKLDAPKDAKSTALAYAGTDAPKHEQSKPEQPKSAQTKFEPTGQQQKPPAVFADAPKPQPVFADASKPPAVFADAPKPQPVFADAPKPRPVFADAFLTSANAGSLFQRTLTISDMKEYVKRTYPSSADFVR
jgi:hypothetical protein